MHWSMYSLPAQSCILTVMQYQLSIKRFFFTKNGICEGNHISIFSGQDLFCFDSFTVDLWWFVCAEQVPEAPGVWSWTGCQRWAPADPPGHWTEWVPSLSHLLQPLAMDRSLHWNDGGPLLTLSVQGGEKSCSNLRLQTVPSTGTVVALC